MAGRGVAETSERGNDSRGRTAVGRGEVANARFGLSVTTARGTGQRSRMRPGTGAWRTAQAGSPRRSVKPRRSAERVEPMPRRSTARAGRARARTNPPTRRRGRSDAGPERSAPEPLPVQPVSCRAIGGESLGNIRPVADVRLEGPGEGRALYGRFGDGRLLLRPCDVPLRSHSVRMPRRAVRGGSGASRQTGIASRRHAQYRRMTHFGK